ncbi:type IVB secretion system protein IcmH/DotU [Pseudomonas bharatica]|uniref:type IVB secretion system protein IcmH/DotU n=1 Tax=Pseudomonas bharatica TaxID=2692112 RepID=UPI003B28A00E
MSTSIKIGSDQPGSGEANPPDSAREDLPLATPAESVEGKVRMCYGTTSSSDQDPDLQFQLRGHSLNPLIDAAQPLLGLVIRLRRIDECGDVTELYMTVREQITAVSEEIRQRGYDGVTQLAYRYALCAFIDEAVMATAWGRASSWPHRSLLSYHHNETWGGEKFFTVLARMQVDPERYRDVLEFKYLCLCLGFEGKYGLQHNNREILNGIIGKLHRVLRSQRGDTPERLTEVPEHVASRRYRLARQWPLWTPWAIAGVLLLGSYLAFSISLGNSTREVLESLEFILKP